MNNPNAANAPALRNSAVLAADDIRSVRPAKLWIPARVFVTAAARVWPLARTIAERASKLGSDVIELKAGRLPVFRDETDREAYVRAKSTLAVVVSPPGQRKLEPIPPSADWQFHLARGCPAHCQYCYLAGSLAGPPITRVYANLPEILEGLHPFLGTGTITSESADRVDEGTTFEASCYTDPLALEHLSGALADTITHFGNWDAPVQLRWTTKFDGVHGLLNLAHRQRTRIRFSVNARSIARRFEGGTASVDSRLDALRRLALAGYPVGLTIAPIMPMPNWREEYEALFTAVAQRVSDIDEIDLTVELITHRFTPGSKAVLTRWYPSTSLEMDESKRSRKHTKFGSTKYVYPKDVMNGLRAFFFERIPSRIPRARILYWT